MRTIDKILAPLDLSRGAPMGMPNIGDLSKASGRIFDCAVPMSEPGYARNGAYFGIGINGAWLRVAYDKDLNFVFFYWAGDEYRPRSCYHVYTDGKDEFVKSRTEADAVWKRYRQDGEVSIRMEYVTTLGETERTQTIKSLGPYPH